MEEEREARGVRGVEDVGGDVEFSGHIECVGPEQVDDQRDEPVRLGYGGQDFTEGREGAEGREGDHGLDSGPLGEVVKGDGWEEDVGDGGREGGEDRLLGLGR